MLASRLGVRAAPARRMMSTASPAPSFRSPDPTYSARMDKTGRPISPHVFIYRFPMIALSSITVRITGVLASAGLFAVGGATLLGGADFVPATVLDFSSVSKKMVGFDLEPAAKAAVGFTIFYQWIGSARHMVWDLTAWGFTNKMMLQSAYACFASSVVVALGLAVYSLPPPKDEKK